MFGHVAPGQDSAVELGMKRLHAPVEHFREAGDVGDLTNRNPRLSEQPGRAAGGDDLDAEPVEPTREIHHARLVVDADQRPADLHRMLTCRPVTWSPPSAKRSTASAQIRCPSIWLRAPRDSSGSDAARG